MNPLSAKNLARLSASVSQLNRPQNMLPGSELFDGVANGAALGVVGADFSSSELSYSELSSSELSFLAFLALAGTAAASAFRLGAAGFSSSDSSSLLSSSELDSFSAAEMV